jgi:acyl dehydratase
MSTMPQRDAPAFRPGLKFPEWDCVITRGQQAEKLACCGLDPALHGDRVDITQLAYAAVLSALRAGLSINGRVHMSQQFDLRAPVLLGEPLRVRGEVVAVTPERRGAVEESRFDFVRPDGSIPLSTRRASLVLDPKVGAARKEGAPRPAEDPRAGAVPIARHQLAPEKVAAYSIEADNLIHSDPETARRFGFRAPIAAGLMAVHFMMAALCRPAAGYDRPPSSKDRGPPTSLRMTVRFRRPMFWDETLEVWQKKGTEPYIALAVVNDEGKATSDCAVDAIAYD